MRKLYGRNLYTDQILNGIAYIKYNNDLIITVKNWPVLFKIKNNFDFHNLKN